MLYFFVILIAMICVEAMTISVSLITGTISLTYAIIAPFFVNAYVLVMLGIVTLLMRICIPKKFWNCNNKLFKVEKKELYFYNKIKIKKWKELVPEMGSTGGFAKRKIVSLEAKYLWKFLKETCFAEFMHNCVGLLGFTILFIMKPQDYYFTFPILIINLILHILPCLIQRYNRYRIKEVYDKVINNAWFTKY